MSIAAAAERLDKFVRTRVPVVPSDPGSPPANRFVCCCTLPVDYLVESDPRFLKLCESFAQRLLHAMELGGMPFIASLEVTGKEVDDPTHPQATFTMIVIMTSL